MSYGFGATVGTGATNRINSTFNNPSSQVPVTFAWSAKRNGAGGNGLGRIMDRNRWFIFYNNTNGVYLFHSHITSGTAFREWTFGSGLLPAGSWHRAVITWSGVFTELPKAWINGVQVAVTETANSSQTTSGISWVIGNSTGSNRVFDGRIAEVSIHTAPLSDANAQSLSQLAIASDFPTNLVFYAPLRTNDLEIIRNEDMSTVGAVLYPDDNPTVSAGGTTRDIASVIAGSDQSTASVNKSAKTASNLTGSDQSTAGAKKSVSVASTTSGNSTLSVSADGSVGQSIAANLSGASSLSVSTGVTRSLASTSFGLSQLAVDLKLTIPIASTSAGAGDLIASAKASRSLIILLTGESDFTISADGRGSLDTAVSFESGSELESSILKAAIATASVIGASTLSLSVSKRNDAQAIFTATSFEVVGIQESLSITARVTGSGDLAVDAEEIALDPNTISATLSGDSQLSVASSIDAQAIAALSGASSLLIALAVSQSAGANFEGLSDLVLSIFSSKFARYVAPSITHSLQPSLTVNSELTGLNMEMDDLIIQLTIETE